MKFNSVRVDPDRMQNSPFGYLPHAFFVNGANAAFWDLLAEAERWCEAELGPPCDQDHFTARWVRSGTVLLVREDVDALAFKLRFG